MSSRLSGPARNPVPIALCMMAVAFIVAIVCAATAHAADYKMLLCAGNNGSNSFDTATNTASGANPGGIFSFENYCGPAGDPAGNGAFLRLAENQGSGNAGETAYGSISWTVPPWVAILAGGGYTREPGSFNDGWRGRFWAEDFSGGGHHILLQGSGVANGSNGGIGWGTTSTFASHLWPFPTYGYYRRFIFEMTCFRPAGCDRSGWNAVDANTITLVLADVSPSQVGLSGGAILSGAWARGGQGFGWSSSDQGSGIRFERLRIDGAPLADYDYRGQCDLDATQASGEFARSFQPCPTGGPWNHGYALGTASLPDGAHTLQVCAQDYSQAAGLDGTGGESCDARAIHTDNTPPGRPAALAIRSSNPARYLDHFGATFSLPPDPGSPIARVHYEVLNGKGEVVVPTKTVSAVNPSELANIAGPAKAGAYRLKVWLEDSVGFQGPPAEVAIPHDTTPPAAPQELHVGGSGTRWLENPNVRWANVVDNGSPIDSARYQLLDSAGEVLDGTHTVSGDNVEAIDNLTSPSQRGHYKLRVWLQDEEGNVGAASTVPLPIDTTPPAAPQDLRVLGTSAHWVERLDLAWRDLTDDGSLIDAAHYRVIDASGQPGGPTQSVGGTDVEAIHGLQTPSRRGNYKVQVWLTDAEGNAGAAANVPLPIDTTPPAAPQGLSVTSPGVSRAAQGFDLHWSDIVDGGSPIDAAHYDILNGAGKTVVPTTTVSGQGIDAIADLRTPSDRGAYTLRLWLSDAEGNAGAPVTAPLAYDCVRSDAGGASELSAGFGRRGAPRAHVRQGHSLSLGGELRSPGGPVSGAPVCVFASVLTDGEREFLGIALTGSDGGYRFALSAGPSRKVDAVYRPGQRQLSADATLFTRVRPLLRARRRVVRNKRFAHFYVRVPGPDNERVVVVLQVRQGKGWRAFRRCRTRAHGICRVGYRFARTSSPATYVMRAQVRRQGGYPYLPGNSRRLRLRVFP